MVDGRLPWPLVFQVLAVAAAVWLVIATWTLWLLVFTALIIAAAILPAARLGERYRIPRGAGLWEVVHALGRAATSRLSRPAHVSALC
jgi:predicted PurR-regulated permease PerM